MARTSSWPREAVDHAFNYGRLPGAHIKRISCSGNSRERADVVNVQVVTESGEILIVDVLSHGNMHHAFNEGYLRVLTAAFPGASLRFLARAEQIERLRPAIADLTRLTTAAVPAFHVIPKFSPHNPLAGTIAARAVRRSIVNATRSDTRLVSVLGVDANLFRVLPRHRRGAPPLHMILHGQLGDAMTWRSRNPWIRGYDFVASVRRGIPRGSSLVALDLGIAASIGQLAPAMAGCVLTLEHPVLARDWADPTPRLPDAPLRLAFLGHTRRTKGFDVFLRLAAQLRGPGRQFLAIGLAAPENVLDDLSSLAQPPSPTGLSRADYLRDLRSVDFVCIPHHTHAYDFTASGTISDAIAALKPLIALRTHVLEAIFAHYGPIGLLATDEQDLARQIAGITKATLAAHSGLWVDNLRRMRAARRPEALGPAYAALLAPP